jgi:hypothetical protein
MSSLNLGRSTDWSLTKNFYANKNVAGGLRIRRLVEKPLINGGYLS